MYILSSVFLTVDCTSAYFTSVIRLILINIDHFFLQFCPEFMIADTQDCKGFDIDFTCEGPGLKLELRESNDELCENICSIGEYKLFSSKCFFYMTFKQSKS